MNSYKSTKLVDPLDNSYYSEKNLRKGDLSSTETFGDNLVYELRQLDSSLDELFLISNGDLNTHHSIHKFRLKVSRRISSFSSILKSLSRQCESLSNPQQKVKLCTLYQFYNDRLMRHKNRLSEWWSRNERRYHTLYLSSFVSQLSDSDKLAQEADPTPYDLTEDEALHKGDEIITKKLRDTRNMMISQINQMDAAESSLLKSSDYISQQEAVLKVLKGKFSTARLTFNLVKRRAIKRYGVVRSCYFFFLLSCAFIVLRRFRVFKIFHLTLKLAYYPVKHLSTSRQSQQPKVENVEF